MLTKSLEFRSRKSITKTLKWLIIPLLLVFLGMRFFDSPLKNEVSPNGIVSFELAKNLDNARAILYSWDTNARTAAGMSMGLDFLFIPLYTVFLILLLQYTKPESGFLQIVCRVICWLLVIAALCDIAENIALIQLLHGDLIQHWVTLAYYMAAIKFGIIFLAIGYLLMQSTYLIFFRKKPTSRKSTSKK